MSLRNKMRQSRLHPKLERNVHTLKDAERALLLLKKVKRDANFDGEGREGRSDCEDAGQSG